MKKQTNNFISNWVLPVVGIGSLIISIKVIKSVNFIPDLSLCNSYPNILCKLPIIRLPLNALSLNFAAGLILYAVIFLIFYFLLKKIGYKESSSEFNYKETKAEKKKWNRYGIYAAIVFAPFYLLFLIFFAE